MHIARRPMGHTLLAILGTLALAFQAVYAEPPGQPLLLHQQGQKIVDEHGSEVKLRGVSLGGWIVWEGWIFGNGMLTQQTTMTTRLEGAIGAADTERFRTQVYEHFITDADIAKIAQAGFNCVRVPLHYRLFENDGGWKLIDRLLGWCEQHRVYAVLDLHVPPGATLPMIDSGHTDHPLWTSVESQRQTVDLWKAIAVRYRNRKIVAGYDLINEPAPPNGAALVKLYERIIAGIRSRDAHHLIFLEGGKFSSDFSMFQKPLCENQAFSFHMYTWFGDDRKQKLAEYVALARRLDRPLWAGEFGENTYEMISSTVQMYNDCPEINGWAFWTWKKAPNTFPGLATIKMPGEWETVMAWLGSLLGGKSPDATKIKLGMEKFGEAMKMRNCEYDQRMEKALLGTKK